MKKAKKEPLAQKRAFWRFSLRTFLLVMLLLSFGFIYFGAKMNRARQRQAAVNFILSEQGTVRYYYEFDENFQYLPKSQPKGPAWIRSWLGKDFFNIDNYFYNLL